VTVTFDFDLDVNQRSFN